MTLKLGLIAKDIKNSVSPKVYTHYGKSIGLETSYDIYNIEEEKLEETLNFCRENLQGFNITMPYKQTALKYMDELHESAIKCGSTNCVLVKDGKLIAYNTDGWGMVHFLKLMGFDMEGKKVVMIGAGGVASAIAYEMSEAKVGNVDVVNIFLNQAEDLCEKYDGNFKPYLFSYETLKNCCENADLVVNASVMGQIGYDEFTSFDFLDVIKKEAFVFDVNYSNKDSKLIPTAKAKGHEAFIGKGMTACQGRRATEIWTGVTPTRESALELVKEFEA